MTKKYATKSALLAELVPTIHEIEHRGTFYRISEMTAAARGAFEQSLILRDEKGAQIGEDISSVRAGLLVATLVDENGARLFTDDERNMLGHTVGAGAIDPLFRFAQQVNGFGKAVVIEDAKNSVPTPTAASPSGSV